MAECALNMYCAIYEDLGDNISWRVSIFEDQSAAFELLERILVEQNDHLQASLVADSRRYRALVSHMSRQHPQEGSMFMLQHDFNWSQMQKLSEEQGVVFLVYSLVPFYQNMNEIWVWIVHSQGSLIWERLSLERYQQDFNTSTPKHL